MLVGAHRFGLQRDALDGRTAHSEGRGRAADRVTDTYTDSGWARRSAIRLCALPTIVPAQAETHSAGACANAVIGVQLAAMVDHAAGKSVSTSPSAECVQEAQGRPIAVERAV